jgi:regulatory protein
MDQSEPPPEDEATAADAPQPGKRRRPELTPQQRALGLLVRREHSRKELARKLTTRGIQAEDAQAAVDRMTAEGWQDDARFAEQLVRSRANNGYGPLHIRAELGTHGLDREAIALAMDGYDGDWGENARGLVRRRFPGRADDPALRRKAADFLIRRGFSGDQVRAAVQLDDDEA